MKKAKWSRRRAAAYFSVLVRLVQAEAVERVSDDFLNVPGRALRVEVHLELGFFARVEMKEYHQANFPCGSSARKSS